MTTLPPSPDAYRAPLLAAAALARRIPCDATRGALYGLCERAVSSAMWPHTSTYRPMVDLLYDCLLGAPEPTAYYAQAEGVTRAALDNAALRLRRLGLPADRRVMWRDANA